MTDSPPETGGEGQAGSGEGQPGGTADGAPRQEAEARPDLTQITDRLRGPLGFLAVAGGVLALIAVLTVAKQARAFVLPIVLAVVLNLLLTPVVRRISGIGVPTAAAAALVLLSLLGATVFGVYRLAGPASDWLERAPRTMRQAEYRLRGLRESMEEVRQAAEQAEALAGESANEREVAVREPTMSESLTSNARSAVVGGAIMFFLLFFMLASGDLFLRKLARVLPRFAHRRKAVAITHRIEDEVSRYLSTLTAINVGLGCAIGLAMWGLGMPNPFLWGVLAGVLNFVPYIGPLIGVVITGLVALTELQATEWAIAVPVAYLVLNGLEGYLVTPLVMGRRLALNPVAILIGVVFWGWLWGIPGALLAVPLIAILKIVADNIVMLKPFGEFLGA